MQRRGLCPFGPRQIGDPRVLPTDAGRRSELLSEFDRYRAGYQARFDPWLKNTNTDTEIVKILRDDVQGPAEATRIALATYA